MKIDFVKVQANGADFVVYADLEGSAPLSQQQIALLCNRNFGVGAAGFVRAVRSVHVPKYAALLAEDSAAEWFLDFYTADGVPAAVTGNAVRAYVAYLISEGLLEPERRDAIPIATRDGIKDVLAGVSGYSADLGQWRKLADCTVTLPHDSVVYAAYGIFFGEQYAVVVLDSVADLEALVFPAVPVLSQLSGDQFLDKSVGSLDRDVYVSSDISGGARVVFATPAEDPLVKNSVGRLNIRVYQQGVGELVASDAGCAAAALAFRYLGENELPHHWNVSMAGGALGVRMFPTEDGEHVSVSGFAAFVYRGEFTLTDC
ncbi:MAG: diaminopimelate epimerase [Microbacteriaceae bacterium]|nr:diaminopimelate epimerase [Microbacteriaceae bacterium]